MKIYLRLEAPFEWVRVSGQHVEAFGEVSSLDDYPVSDEDEIIGVVPGEWVTTHLISLPAKTKKQFNIALPYALEDSISEDVENMHFVCGAWKANTECPVLVVSKDKMREWQVLATKSNLPIERLIPEHALIPFHDAADCSIAACGNQFVINQRQGGGVSIDKDLLDVWIMQVPISSTIAANDQELVERLISQHPDRDFRHWPFGYKMSHWLEQPHLPTHDLWTEQFRPQVRRFGLRAFVMPLAIVALALLGKFAFDTYRYFSLHAEIRAIQTESQAIFKQTLPEMGDVPLGQERTMMEQALSRMGGADQSRGLPKMLADVSNVLRSQNVTLAELSFRDNEMLITCQLSDFSQIDRLTNQLNARPGLTASLQSSAADDGEIVASYMVTQR